MHFVLSNSDAEYFYRELAGLLTSDATPVSRFFALRGIFGDILAAVTSSELQFFSTSFARWQYVCDRNHIPAEITDEVNALHRFDARLRTKSTACGNSDVEAGTGILVRLIRYFSSTEIPSDFNEHNLSSQSLKKQRYEAAETIPLLRAAITGKPEYVEKPLPAVIIPAVAESEEAIRIALTGDSMYLGDIVWNGAIVHLTNMMRSRRDSTLLTSSDTTLAILEPDILLDVTAVAECFQTSGANFRLYFLHRFKSFQPTPAILLGTIANVFFDALLENPDADFNLLFDRSLQQKPLAALAALKDSPVAMISLMEAARKHFYALRTTVPKLRGDKLNIEPTFISPIYGLQGRLDLMLEYNDEPLRKTVVELKSGSAPQPDARAKLYHDQPSLPLGMHPNHYAQTTAYNLLLDSAFPGRIGDSSVLYSSDRSRPLRNAPNIKKAKSAILQTRNQIAAAENTLMNRKFNLFEEFTPEKFGAFPVFSREDIHDFANMYRGLSALERGYYQAFTSFIIREQYTARCGSSDSDRAGFAALWQDSLEEKRERMTALTDLSPIKEESDLDRLHITFHRYSAPASFRVGDIVLAYPILAEGSINPVERQIIKAVIREISPDRVKISLRNKLLGDEFFPQKGTSSQWIIESDFMDTGFENLHRSLTEFLRIPKHNRNILLGLSPPQFTAGNTAFGGQEESVSKITAKLHPEQRELFTRAITARDYFLLQGPPGTGKTSVMLKAIIEYLYVNTDGSVLLLAFTNRAVDEICASLRQITADFPFIRIGGKEQKEYEKDMLWKISEDLDAQELEHTISRTRFFTATASAALANPEIFTLKKFSTLIVDEASQLIEPYLIGLFSKAKRRILIGDEKQLPAVVTQSERGSKVKRDDFEQICLTDLRMSLFERLLRCCKLNGWNEGFGMLQRQARMHKDIEQTVNRRFYFGALRPMNDWQNDEKPAFARDNSLIGEIAAAGRAVFIPSPREFGAKIHQTEARRTVQIALSIAAVCGEDFNSKTVGIIAPFRAQTAEIIRALPPELRSIITVDTVERYQGSERDTIIISAAVNFYALMPAIQSTAEFEGKLIDRKLNVALTRARKQIIILGCEDILRSSPVYSELLDEIPCLEWPDISAKRTYLLGNYK